MNTNIFNIDDQSDLPEIIKKALSRQKIHQHDQKIMSLFKLSKRELTIDEILIGLYRKYNMTCTRPWLANRIFNLKKTNRISKVAKGLYILKED